VDLEVLQGAGPQHRVLGSLMYKGRGRAVRRGLRLWHCTLVRSPHLLLCRISVDESVVPGVVDTAVPDDPNELSFKKGEVLQILDKSGKWWEARKDDGTEGSKSFF
jgi:SH3 domain